MGHTETGDRGWPWLIDRTSLTPASGDWAYIFPAQQAWQKASASSLVAGAEVPGLTFTGQMWVTSPSPSWSGWGLGALRVVVAAPAWVLRLGKSCSVTGTWGAVDSGWAETAAAQGSRGGRNVNSACKNTFWLSRWQHPRVPPQPQALPGLHCPVECLHDALHDRAVWLMSPRYRNRNPPPRCRAFLPPLLMTSRMALTWKPVIFPESPSSWWVEKVFAKTRTVSQLRHLSWQRYFHFGFCIGMLSA